MVKYFFMFMCFMLSLLSYAALYNNMVPGSGFGFGFLSFLSGVALFVIWAISEG